MTDSVSLTKIVISHRKKAKTWSIIPNEKNFVRAKYEHVQKFFMKNICACIISFANARKTMHLIGCKCKCCLFALPATFLF